MLVSIIAVQEQISKPFTVPRPWLPQPKEAFAESSGP
jgi:hypothetical protein